MSKFKHIQANVKYRFMCVAGTGQMRDLGAGSSNYLGIMWFKKKPVNIRHLYDLLLLLPVLQENKVSYVHISL